MLARMRWVSSVTHCVAIVALCGLASAEPNPVSLKERGVDLRVGPTASVDKRCCGYPIASERGFALRFYWLAMENRFLDHPLDTDIYSPEGYRLGVYSARFVRALRMEGSGVLADGRVIHYAGRCKYGMGTCFRILDHEKFPFGKGASRRTLTPFKSVAVDPRFIPLGESLYIPEFDGLLLPDGTHHDGCVRADDTGGNIKKRKMDFFVVRYDNFRFLLDALYGEIAITPHIESPHCEYMRIVR